ncbi:hypothetical protein HG535_0A02230 [Zygotorulaspora mrakii]|uniref:Chitobiosyldiphosphodolichol beta-mannosyltransferase n=1 Tax=Zygotorulaspora mrakii TaxID=42260 RepID=A0A7H9AVH8_ZYGMR|nr:uncharacterized protein HG535_0A02230 [Zygotorulaspora mrakii]QLG70285.1 hypothetical protein HG535_0A02230 [Zygotorulaspora mrakii]
MLMDTEYSWWIALGSIYMALPLLAYTVIPYLFYGNRSTKKRIIVYVIGDLGHSPRMCNQAASFSKHGWEVELCGYLEGAVPKFIEDDPNITIHELPVCDHVRGKQPLAAMIHKVTFQMLAISKQLWKLRGSDYLLMQNPPSIPIMPLAVLYRFTGCKLIIDWHNLGYSILQLKFGSFYHPFVLIYYMIEYFFSKFATYNLTVTKAMKDYLVKNFGLKSKRCVVLYDRPSSQFGPLSTTVDRSHALHNESFIKDYVPKDFDLGKGDKVFVTSTSFTPDEDIGILIGALKIYENSCKKFDKSLPKILCFITGKGLLKQKFIERVRQEKWEKCNINFLWLSPTDYPKLLQLCDYGISLHTSSSGLDLPMKILDMLGSGLPVIASNYPVLEELLVHEKNGLKFLDRRELHEALVFAMKDANIYKSLHETVLLEQGNRWDSSWKTAMKEINLIN